jgi:hypothetical protein
VPPGPPHNLIRGLASEPSEQERFGLAELASPVSKALATNTTQSIAQTAHDPHSRIAPFDDRAEGTPDAQ